MRGRLFNIQPFMLHLVCWATFCSLLQTERCFRFAYVKAHLCWAALCNCSHESFALWFRLHKGTPPWSWRRLESTPNMYAIYSSGLSPKLHAFWLLMAVP